MASAYLYPFFSRKVSADSVTRGVQNWCSGISLAAHSWPLAVSYLPLPCGVQGVDLPAPDKCPPGTDGRPQSTIKFRARAWRLPFVPPVGDNLQRMARPSTLAASHSLAPSMAVTMPQHTAPHCTALHLRRAERASRFFGPSDPRPQFGFVLAKHLVNFLHARDPAAKCFGSASDAQAECRCRAPKQEVSECSAYSRERV